LGESILNLTEYFGGKVLCLATAKQLLYR